MSDTTTEPQATATADDFTPTRCAATYNVLDGAWEDPEGLVRVLAGLGADVIALQECRGWDEEHHARLHEVASALGMQALFAPSGSNRCHIVLLYHPETFHLDDWTPDAAEGRFQHTLLRARLTVHATDEKLTVLATHLSPLGGATRAVEAGWLTQYAEPGRSAVLLGDLNTIGAGDPEPDWTRFPPHLYSRHRTILPNGEWGPADRRAMHILVGAGWTDPFAEPGREFTPTVGHFRPDEPGPHRSDHILLSPALANRLVDCAVIDTDQTRRLSNHLPVRVRWRDGPQPYEKEQGR
ncbi:endonuclease/exonuclease/phosphatase family protein [Embleya sp. AB8]|uniref:endonuclease/exonuclease/phosphatase family protein n=1 Tax=Embleya sp. AB8 TaxID=3156304 RepID=UPI003C78CD09